MLDKVGLSKKDGEGFRLRPDGKRLLIRSRWPAPRSSRSGSTAATLVSEFWKKVGVNTVVKNEDRTLFYERKDANQARRDRLDR